MSNNHYNNNLQPFANNLRKTMTKAEACLWKYALKSRHSHSIDDIIENDIKRQNELELAGYYVLRFSDHDVLKDMVNVILRIEAVVEKLEKSNAPDPPPAPASGGHSNTNHLEIGSF